MPRPQDKQALLELADANLAKLVAFIAALPPEVARGEHELNDRDRTVADVVCHLHEWHNMMVGWYRIGMSGAKPVIPAEGVTWQTLPVLNRRIHQKYAGTPLDQALAWLKASHATVRALIDAHTDEQLFTKKRYPWTGTTSLGSYLVSATSSHYDWALKTLKPLRNLGR